MSSVTKIGEEKTISVSLDSNIRMFEKAIDRATMMAQINFGMDEDGHTNVPGWERCCCSLVVEFQSLRMSSGMGGAAYDFKFKVWCEKYEE